MSRRQRPDREFDDILDIEEPASDDGEAGDEEGEPGEDGSETIAEWIDSLDEVASRALPGDEVEGGPDWNSLALVTDLVGEEEAEAAGGDEPPADPVGEWGDLVGDDHECEAAERDPARETDLDDDWFIDGDCPAAEADDGDGPLEDRIDGIDERGWNQLDDEDDEDGDPLPLEHAGGSVGIESLMDAEPHRPAARMDRGMAVELSSVGPGDGEAVAIALRGGVPVAVGDEVFVLGADGMLHAVREGLPGSATSVCLLGEGIIVGTLSAGAWRYDHSGAAPAPINGWFSRDPGFETGAGITTPIEVFAGRRADSALFGLTGEGQLFSSRDFGDHWAGPLTEGPCLAAAAEEDSGELAALIAGADGLFLVRGQPGRLRPSRIADGGIEALLRAGPPRMVVAGDSVAAIPAEPGSALLLSLAGGGFVPLPAAAGATAVVLDGDDPDWIAAGFVPADGDRAEVRVSGDGGRSFRRALVIEGRDGAEPPAVTAMAAEFGTTTRVWVVTGNGVFRLVMRQRTRGH